MLKIYVAAPWADKHLALEAKNKLEAAGYEVTSRWISFHEDKPSDGMTYDTEVLRKEAIHDIQDVARADVLILLNTQKRGEETSGKAVEFGMALAWEKGIIMVGERSNIFHYLGHLIVGTIEEAIIILDNTAINRENTVVATD